MSFRTKHSGVLTAIASCLLSLTGFAASLADSVFLYTPNTKIAVTPGQSVDYTVDLINNSTEVINTDILLRGLPSSWNYSLKSGSFNIQKISVLPGERKNLNLTIGVPIKVNKGNYQFKIVAGKIPELLLNIVVSEQWTFKTEFTAEQANMQGNSSSIFTYQVMLRNSTAEKQLYAIVADAPPGWNVIFRSNSRQVTSVEVNENSSAGIVVEIDPPDMIEAGSYKVPIHATTSSTSADLVLEVVVSGTFTMDLSTPTGLLSTDITAGDQKRIELLLRNTGSSPLKNIQMISGNPINWEVTFDPKKLDLVEPGKSAQVFAVVKAAKNAIAGDYVTNIEARTVEVSSKVQLRISVETSLIWGWVGILVICAALGCVYYLFRKYGRR